MRPAFGRGAGVRSPRGQQSHNNAAGDHGRDHAGVAGVLGRRDAVRLNCSARWRVRTGNPCRARCRAGRKEVLIRGAREQAMQWRAIGAGDKHRLAVGQALDAVPRRIVRRDGWGGRGGGGLRAIGQPLPEDSTGGCA